MAVRVSFIVPVYNGAGYLPDFRMALERLVERDWEVILVDDGSTDESGRLLEEWRAQDPRVKVLSQANSGQGVARNRGFDLVCGEFVLFLDVDDLVHPEIASGPVEWAKSLGADVLQFGFASYHERGSPPSAPPQKGAPVSMSPRDAFFELFPAAWAKVFRSDYLRNVGVRYPGYKYEDNVEILRLCCHGGRFYQIPGAYYFYYQNPQGTVRTLKTKLDIFLVLRDLESLALQYPQYCLEIEVQMSRLYCDLRAGIAESQESWKIEAEAQAVAWIQTFQPRLDDNPYVKLPKRWHEARRLVRLKNRLRTLFGWGRT